MTKLEPEQANREQRPAGPEAMVSAPKGRPMLQWYGKRTPRSVPALPAQVVEVHGGGAHAPSPPYHDDQRGLLFHGDNKEVLGHLLANGMRGRVNLIYIDPPFDSKADYVRTVELRGTDAAAGPMRGGGYSLGEQVQYSDIWSNDNYLQFMFERLLLLKELLADDGAIWLHCDWHRSHVLRCIMDEVFGPEALVNEVVWQRTDPHNDAKSRLGNVHDTLLWYRRGDAFTYNWEAVTEGLSEAALKEYSLIKLDASGEVLAWNPGLDETGVRFKLDDCTYKGADVARRFVWRGARPSNKRVWPYATPEEMDAAVGRGEFHLRDPARGAARCRVSVLGDRGGQVLQSIWSKVGRMKGGNEYPTEKPEALLARIIEACSRPGDLVLDCFSGSGTTLVAAERLGRRWVGADINKGAIQLAARRLCQVMGEATADATAEVRGGRAPEPSAAGFAVLRVNDYDLALQHNEAVALACEAVGIERSLADPFFEGRLGPRLAKVTPFNHPLSPADLSQVAAELDARPAEDRDVVVVCLGKEARADAWLAEYNRLRRADAGLGRIEVIELRTDERYGRMMVHEPATAKVSATREGTDVRVVIEDFVSPTIVKRLRRDLEGSAVQARIRDWRSMAASVMVDVDHDGTVFRAALTDAPSDRSQVVDGEYRLPLPATSRGVAVRITDCLGEDCMLRLAP